MCKNFLAVFTQLYFHTVDDSSRKSKYKYTQGRLWINRRSDYRTLLQIEWNLGKSSWRGGIHLDFCPEEGPDVIIGFGLPFLFYFYIHFGWFPAWLKKRIQHEYSPRENEIILSFLEGLGQPWLFIKLWYAEGIYNHSGYSKAINIPDLVFGRAKHSSVENGKHIGFVKLPEQIYQVDVTLSTDTWKRPLWPIPYIVERAHIECGKDGIPAHAGKGENSYDLDDDYVFSCTMPVPKGYMDVAQIEVACQSLAKDIIRDRKRYGQPDHAMKSIIQRNLTQ